MLDEVITRVPLLTQVTGDIARLTSRNRTIFVSLGHCTECFMIVAGSQEEESFSEISELIMADFRLGGLLQLEERFQIETIALASMVQFEQQKY